jgi:hypothetical protein
MLMPALWIHRKVYLAWTRYAALQLTLQWDEWSLGVRVNLRRPLLDFYSGPLTIAFGKHAVYTDPRTRTWDSCRGMLFPDDQYQPLDVVEARVL